MNNLSYLPQKTEKLSENWSEQQVAESNNKHVQCREFAYYPGESYNIQDKVSCTRNACNM